MTEPLVWLIIWVGVLMILAPKTPEGVLGAMFTGFIIWCICGFAVFLWSALSVNHCVEYGYPDLHDTSEGKTCTDDEIREHIEKENR